MFVKSEVPGIVSKQRTGQILTSYQYNGLVELTRLFKLPKMIDPSILILCLLRAERDPEWKAWDTSSEVSRDCRECLNHFPKTDRYVWLESG